MLSAGLYVIAGQHSLIPDVQLAAADDRVSPTRPALIRDLEPPFLLVTGRRSFRESHDVVLAQEVQVAVSVGETSLPHAAITPGQKSSRKVDAYKNRT